MTRVAVRRIRGDEGGLLRELRLTALRHDPAAFGQRYDEALAEAESEWAAAARSASTGHRRAWFLAQQGDGQLIGLVLGRRRPPSDCLLFSMWVDPSARQQGTGRKLVQAVADWAAGWGAARIVLWVILGNEEARRFYERIGFRVLTDGPDADSGAAHGALAMERPIQPRD